MGTKHIRTHIPKPLPEECRIEQPLILPPNSGKIILSRGLFAIVDLWRVDELNEFNWCAAANRWTVYAHRRGQNKETIKMHRQILGLSQDDGTTTDHINGNGLDNRYENLRIIGNAENNHLSKRVLGKTSKFKGVSFSTHCDRWVSSIRGKVAYHATELQAAKYYDEQATRIFGNLACTNESIGLYTDEDYAREIEQIKTVKPIIRRPRKKSKDNITPKEVTLKAKKPAPFETVPKIIKPTLKVKYDKQTCLSPTEFEKLLNRLDAAEKRVTLLEETLRATEQELKRANQKITELGL